MIPKLRVAFEGRIRGIEFGRGMINANYSPAFGDISKANGH